jgi:hypothetical protein
MISLFKNFEFDDLKDYRQIVQIKRPDVQIVVIDDETFPPLEELRRHQFNITFYKDIERICVLSDFDIIITDIKGVGKHLGSSLEGAHLIEEINKMYPHKYLISYSASTFDISLNKYFGLCDDQKRKDTDINEWTKTLDNAINSIHDPIYQWEKTRKVLLKHNISSKQITVIEKAFIKSIMLKNKNHFKKVIDNNISISENSTTSIVLQSLCSFASSFISSLVI